MNRASGNGEPLRDQVGSEVFLATKYLWKTWNCGSCYTIAAASSSIALALAVLPASLRMDSEIPCRNITPAVLGSATSFRNKAL